MKIPILVVLTAHLTSILALDENGDQFPLSSFGQQAEEQFSIDIQRTSQPTRNISEIFGIIYPLSGSIVGGSYVSMGVTGEPYEEQVWGGMLWQTDIILTYNNGSTNPISRHRFANRWSAPPSRHGEPWWNCDLLGANQSFWASDLLYQQGSYTITWNHTIMIPQDINRNEHPIKCRSVKSTQSWTVEKTFEVVETDGQPHEPLIDVSDLRTTTALSPSPTGILYRNGAGRGLRVEGILAFSGVALALVHFMFA